MRLLSVLARSGESLAGFRRTLPRLAGTPELRIPCAEHCKRSVVAEVRRRLEEEGARIVTIDGVRVSAPGGWWLLRASNTEPALAARCEAANEAALDAIKSALARHLAASGVDVPTELATRESPSVVQEAEKQLDQAFAGALDRS